MLKIRTQNTNQIMIILLTLVLFTSILNQSLLAATTSGPDFLLETRETIPNILIEDDVVTFKLKITNNGETYNDDVEIALFLNGIKKSEKIMNGLSAGNSKDIDITWTAEIGEYYLRISVDPDELTGDINYFNNDKEKYIEVVERDTDINIEGFHVPENPYIGEISEIYANVTNIGRNTTQTIKSTLTITKEDTTILTETKSKTGGLSKGDYHNFSYEWDVITFGPHTINITITRGGTIEDSDEEDVGVDVVRLTWWNDSWHYRKFIGVSDDGIISRNLNFTALLEDIDLEGKTFENDTIRIIKYNSRGNITGEVDEYLFNESETFDAITNATGRLTWTSDTSATHYYGIYFDVEENNLGIRKSINETEDLKESENIVTFLNDSKTEGWWSEFIQPNRSFYPANTTIENIIATMAKATSVVADVYLDTTLMETLILASDGNNTIWSESKLFEEGNWTLKIRCEDAAGFSPDISLYTFYAGLSDLAVRSISFSPSKPSQKGSVTIKADIRAYNATVDDVVVSLFIDDELTENKTEMVAKDKQNIIEFEWEDLKIGTYAIKIVVDPNNSVEESNESNNELSKNLTVEGLPDLMVREVYLPVNSVEEGSKAEIKAVINNTGNTDANNYEVELYLYEPEDPEESMKWLWKVNHTYVSVKVNKSKTVSLFWEPTIEGTWMVGLRISRNENSLTTGNKSLTSKELLIVTPTETTGPTIKNIKYPDEKEQGKTVTITADITDSSGVKSAVVYITNPKNTTYEESMTNTKDNEYKYVFSDTEVIGEYSFYIQATDSSLNKNKAKTSTKTFHIVQDESPPTIEYFDAHPRVQLTNETLKIICIATDYMEIEKMEVVFVYPNAGGKVTEKMKKSSDEYSYSQKFQAIGKYKFYIKSEDSLGNKGETEKKEFWITDDLNDTDGDGMPDWWEEKHDFNPYDPSDGENDEDNDGFTNAEEFKRGTNPYKDVLLENMFSFADGNGEYIVISIVLFVILTIFSIVGLRRQK